MSKITEYLAASVGYDQNGLPASTTQFTFGFSPFQIAETENIADVTEIVTVCHSDAIVDIKIIDSVAMVSFDFSNETQILTELAMAMDTYNDQKQHVTESLNRIMSELTVAERNEDEDLIEELNIQLRSMSIPFMLPTIMPVCYDGTVHIGFADDPKFVFFTSDQLNQQPYKITMIFDAYAIFCEDEMAIYTEDPEEELMAQREELWYIEEAKKLEEENYQAQFGFNSGDPYADDRQKVDKKLKGVRIK